jgi:sugar lactone lactonase YvrE
MKVRAALVTLFLAIMSLSQTAVAKRLEGIITVGDQPVAGASVTLWRTAGNDAPKSVAEVSTGDKGEFTLHDFPLFADGGVFYLTTRGGAHDALTLMSVLGTEPPDKVVVNELTTVASAFTSARFINGTSISGNELGLRIAAGNAPNLVDPVTGTWGKVLLDPLNSTQTTTLAKLNTLGSMITAFATVADDAWRARFLKASTPIGGATPTNTLEAMAGIARTSWADPKGLYALFDQAYPQPKDGSRRSAPFVPYLALVPNDFALSLNFAGGGMFANGKFMFDADGNLWSGQNWMPGSQSGTIRSIGGGVIKVTPDGTILSPPITGYDGMGTDGIGWGTAVGLDKVWTTSFNGKILALDFEGNPVGKEGDIPVDGKLGGLQGVGVANNGDIWIADATKNQLVYFPKGELKDGRIVNVEGMKSPFGVAIDAQNRVWVSNAQSDTVVRFPADDPSKAETYRAGIAVRGIALDSKGNLWTASNFSLDFPPPKIPDGTPILLQFKLAVEHLQKTLVDGKTTGVVNLILADGTQPEPKGFEDEINVPWGINIDGNDDVWVAGFWAKNVVLMAGHDTTGHPEGTKAGDVIHVFTSGGVQINTDVQIDPAGNVWSANNWNNVEAAIAEDPDRATSTWGGGTGVTVFYGIAEPVKTPLVGPVQRP